MNLQAQRLSGAEVRKLGVTLQRAHAGLSVNLLKGYLFAVATTPAMLKPDEWLRPLFDGDLAQLFADEWLINALMRLYNQTIQEVNDGSAKLPPNCKLDKVRLAHNFAPPSPLHQWSAGFEWGVDQFADHWELVEGSELAQQVELPWSFLAFFGDSDRIDALLETLTEDNPPIEQMIAMIREQMPSLIRYYAQLSRDLYLQRVESTEDSSEPCQNALFESNTPFTDSNVVPFSRPGLAADTNLHALIDEAHQTLDPGNKVALAERVLAQDPDHVEAYLILATWHSADEMERASLLEQAVAAGERSLGSEFINANAGHFWGIWETRPYMEALADLAESYRLTKRSQQAIAIYARMLRLNPNDNQGIRSVLLPLYIEAHQLAEADGLLADYQDDESAFMSFSQALLAFIRQGDTPASRAIRKQALDYNKHVAKLLAGRSKMPHDLPQYYGPGEKSEAVIFVHYNQALWRGVIGSIPWLLKK